MGIDRRLLKDNLSEACEIGSQRGKGRSGVQDQTGCCESDCWRFRSFIVLFAELRRKEAVSRT